MTLLIIVPIIEALPNDKLSCETKIAKGKGRAMERRLRKMEKGKQTFFDDSFEAACVIIKRKSFYD
jgi:hypothetical protein